MRLAIMQPYLFPYIGYFQLIKAVDKFILYDEVSYIKGGWINRNYILLGEERHLFTLPLKHSSSWRSIKDTQIDSFNYQFWKKRFLKTITCYKTAPYYAQVKDLLETALDTIPASIAEFNASCLSYVCSYLNLNTLIVKHSEAYGERKYQAQDQILYLCGLENATTYINPIGGVELYSKEEFDDHRIKLLFLKTGDVRYRQFDGLFQPNLSIIDVMMFNSVESVNRLLTEYELI